MFYVVKYLSHLTVFRGVFISYFMCKVFTHDKSSMLEEKIEKFCQNNTLTLGRNSDIIRFGKNLGFDIFKMPLDNEKIDGVILFDNEEKLIGVNESLDLQDSRFVIAHEIAHFITQKLETQSGEAPFFAMRDKILHGEKKAPLENDMDYMAAAILVPKDLFMKDLKALNIDIKDKNDEKTVKDSINDFVIQYLSQLYNVKDSVIIRRIAELSYYA